MLERMERIEAAIERVAALIKATTPLPPPHPAPTVSHATTPLPPPHPSPTVSQDPTRGRLPSSAINKGVLRAAADFVN